MISDSTSVKVRAMNKHMCGNWSMFVATLQQHTDDCNCGEDDPD
jgi:hypothetical protein